jgi:hypothetical protein
MLDLPLNLSPNPLKGPCSPQGLQPAGPSNRATWRAADRAFRPACNTRKRLSLEHMRLLRHRSASVHNNERPASFRSDATTKVASSPQTLRHPGSGLRPLVGHLSPLRGQYCPTQSRRRCPTHPLTNECPTVRSDNPYPPVRRTSELAQCDRGAILVANRSSFKEMALSCQPWVQRASCDALCVSQACGHCSGAQPPTHAPLRSAFGAHAPAGTDSHPLPREASRVTD